MSVTIRDLFCGAGGSSLGAELAGGELKHALNHWDRAIETHATNFQHADHSCADIASMTTAQIRRFDPCDLLWASPECFPAGAQVLTKRGLIGIEQVQIGDFVLTHRRRWRRVTKTMSKRASTIMVRGEGNSCFETTPSHPVLARQRSRYWDNSIRAYRHRFGDEQWCEADQLSGRYWCSVTDFGEPLSVPDVPGRGMPFSEDFWWMVGRWLGDGLLRITDRARRPVHPPYTVPKDRRWPAPCLFCGNESARNKRWPDLASAYCSKRCSSRASQARWPRRRGEVQITSGRHEAAELIERLNFATPTQATRAITGELRWRQRSVRTGIVFVTAHRGLAEWLRDNFGRGAAGKTIPAWALTMPVNWREALLAGYMSADGHDGGRRVSAASVSRSLAVGIRLLALSLGYKPGISIVSDRTAGVIEGRTVQMRRSYGVQWTAKPDPTKERTLVEAGRRWSKVRSVEPCREKTQVFNLSVEEDETYLVDGLVVHNCTNHSIAKGAKRRPPRRGSVNEDGPAGDDEQERSRATMWDVVRFCEQARLKGHPYKAVIVENVVDAAKWGYEDDGGLFQAWLQAMRALGYLHELVFLNSMFCWPTPQSRDRLYVVFWRKGMRRPDLRFEPRCYCPGCDALVDGYQAFKRPDGHPALGHVWGRYGAQYLYRCPRCHQPALPAVHPASSIIDWTIECERIGDREKPLARNTRERIRRGLDRLSLEPFEIRTAPGGVPRPLCLPVVTLQRPVEREMAMVMPVAGNTFERTPGNRARDARLLPLDTVHTTHDRALVIPTVQNGNGRPAASTNGNGHRNGNGAAANGVAAVSGVVELQRHGTVRPVDGPLHTIRARGRHHGLVMANTENGVPREACRYPSQTLRTEGGLAVIIPYNRTGQARAADTEPMPTLTTHDRAAMLISEPDIDDCLFRMFTLPEIAGAMVMSEHVDGSEYVITGNKREQMAQMGNAVTPPAARELISRLIKVL